MKIFWQYPVVPYPLLIPHNLLRFKYLCRIDTETFCRRPVTANRYKKLFSEKDSWSFSSSDFPSRFRSWVYCVVNTYRDTVNMLCTDLFSSFLPFPFLTILVSLYLIDYIEAPHGSYQNTWVRITETEASYFYLFDVSSIHHGFNQIQTHQHCSFRPALSHPTIFPPCPGLDNNRCNLVLARA